MFLSGFDEGGGPKYVNSNFFWGGGGGGGACNRGAKRPVTHKLGHMLGVSGFVVVYIYERAGFILFSGTKRGRSDK